jgi:hypothetical protein
MSEVAKLSPSPGPGPLLVLPNTELQVQAFKFTAWIQSRFPSQTVLLHIPVNCSLGRPEPDPKAHNAKAAGATQ